MELLIQWACTELLKTGFHITTVIRALNSYETEAGKETSLDKLAYKIAESLNAKYKPSLLKKIRPNRPLKEIA